MSNCARPDNGPRPPRRLRDAHALAQLGDGAFYVTSAAYLLRLGWSASEVGLVLGVCWGVGALLARRIGHLADRRGLTAVSAVAMGCCAVGLLGLALADPVVAGWAFLLYAVGQSAWGGLRATLVQVVAAPATAVIARARLQAVGNGAVAVGAALGGVALAFEGTSALRMVVALDATLYVAAACLIGRGTGLPAREIRAFGDRLDAVGPPRRTTRPQLVATAAAAALYLYMPMLSVALPLMITRAPGIPVWVISACFLANTTGVMAFQRRAAAMTTTASGSRRALAAGGTLLAVSCALLWTATHMPDSRYPLIVVGLAAGVLTQILGEVCFAAGAWDLGYRLAPASGAAAWQTTYAAAIPIARSVGPAVLAPLAAVPAGWLAPAALFLAGSAAMVGVTASPRRSASTAGRRPHTEPEATEPTRPPSHPTGSAA